MTTTYERNSTKQREEKVIVTDKGEVPASYSEFPKNWPDGAELRDMVGSFCVTEDPADYWQGSARWALLNKYKKLPDYLRNRYLRTDGGIKRLQLSKDDMQAVNLIWANVCEDDNGSNDDLLEFLKTSRSNQRKMQWSIMDCDSACQFKLHAHPNIELIYCVRGSLHEIRMDGEPLPLMPADEKNEVPGPNLTSLDRPWYFDTLYQGQWLVNEVGSVHKSFTATNGDGCVLLVLWGGSHANVNENQFPQRVKIQASLEHMDQKLGTCPNCCQWDALKEIFLPDSEKNVVGSTE